MPNAPIGGISIIVHLFVILVYQIARGIVKIFMGVGVIRK